MKGKRLLLLGLIMLLVSSSVGFADVRHEDQPLGDMQERLFAVEGQLIQGLCSMTSFTYDTKTETIEPTYERRPKDGMFLSETEWVGYTWVDSMIEDRGTCYLTYRRKGIDNPVFSIELENLYKPRSLYVTEDYIIIWYWDNQDLGCIQRYTYEGKLAGSVSVSDRFSACIEGPEGSTLYLRKTNVSGEFDQEPCLDPLELIQINWDSKATSVGPMHHIVQEKTRTGLTLARFTDSGFGLLRAEDPETDQVDYKAPIRSQENRVQLQIPYCDMATRLSSGARNLLVAYKDQEIDIPMTLFDCADLLADMPCQDDATIEIILQSDEAGNVTYTIQLFVVEQTDAITKVVHRKTIQ